MLARNDPSIDLKIKKIRSSELFFPWVKIFPLKRKRNLSLKLNYLEYGGAFDFFKDIA